jgi:hypothetical protein
MKTSMAEFIQERARLLAFVVLTRRDDVAVDQVGPRLTIDYLVSLSSDGTPTGRVFGVKVEGHDGGRAALPLPQEPVGAEEAPFPVCVFLFMMEGDRGVLPMAEGARRRPRPFAASKARRRQLGRSRHRGAR